MDGNAIPVNENTTVIVKASGDLFLQGAEEMEVRFQSSEDRIRVNQSNDTLYVETHSSMNLLVPRRAKVIIEKIGGSALVQDLEADLSIQKVGGDLGLRRVGIVRIEKIGGGALIEDVTGQLQIMKIGGDLSLRRALSHVQVNSIGGEGDLQLLGAGPLEARAGGDLRVYYTEQIGGPGMLRAGGNVELFVPSGASARFDLVSDGETITLTLAGIEGGQRHTLDTRRYSFASGEGEGPAIEARAGGDITVSDEHVEPQPITGELDQRQAAWEEARNRFGFPSWTGGFGFDRSSAWADMISRRAQEAARRAEQRAHSAMRRTEDQIRMAAERQIRQSMENMNFGPGFPVPPVPPAPPPVEPVTEKERLMVLQMLQDGKITVDQAEQLLAALEGKTRR